MFYEQGKLRLAIKNSNFTDEKKGTIKTDWCMCLFEVRV